MTAENPQSAVLLTDADIRRWTQDVENIEQQIEELTWRRDELKAWLAAAAVFAERTDVQSPGAPELGDSAAAFVAIEGLASDASWGVIVETYVGIIKRVSYNKLREAVCRSKFSERFQYSDAGYYNGISRGIRNGNIVKYNGYLFDAGAHKEFSNSVEVGLIEDRRAPSEKVSPMTEAIFTIVTDNPGANSRLIVEELKKNAEFAAVLSPHLTAAYNVLGRMVKRRQLIKRDGRFHLGPAKPASATSLYPTPNKTRHAAGPAADPHEEGVGD